ncbi:MAG: STAS domain-containing protein [Chloroflexota bacterium]
MQLTVEQEGPATVIAVEGSIDALTANEFQETMQAQLSNGNVRLVADFSGVDYASSAGLRAIILGLKESRQSGGDLRLAAVRKGVYRVLELSGIDSILKIYDDVAGAVASYGEEA